MKTFVRQTVSLFLVFCLCLSIFPIVAIEAQAKSITVYSQYDNQWKNHPYGYKNYAGTDPATIGSGGCGILSLVNAVFYMNGNFIDPIALADWSVNNGHRRNGEGTYHSLYPAYSKAYGNTYGFSCSSSNGISADSWSELASHLLNGGTAIAPTSGKYPEGHKNAGKSWGHLLVIADFDPSNNKYLILDSSAASYRGTSSGYAWLTKEQVKSYMNPSKFILISNTVGPGHITHTYSGSYYEAAHPHKVYQKCSCGATQYTGATTKVDSCSICNPVNTTSKYNAVLPFVAYLKGTSTVYPYTTEHLATKSGGEIWTTDECTITKVYSNGACEVKYPTKNGNKTAYTSLSDFIDNTGASLVKQTADRKIVTYIRASTSSTAYGHVSAGDTIYILGTSGNMTQIFYPTPSGFKLAWVKSSELQPLAPPEYDNRFNPYCPIKCYPCATATFDVYESDRSTYRGKIYVTDDCVIKEVFADGWCYVDYPANGTRKQAYAQLSNFVYNVSATHLKYTANAQINVHKDKSLPGDLKWYISPGDQFFVVGSYGSTSQVFYPVDAQYGGGYKLGWISTADLPKTTYTVSYNPNGGSGAPANQTKTHGEDLQLTTAVPNRDGYTFVGWATSSNATGAAYLPGSIYRNDANLTLYAVWTRNKYELSYNANGGTNAPATQNKVHGTNLTLSSTIPTKNYTVTFNANGGTVDVTSRQVNCEFLGWATSASATSTAYQPGGTFTANENTTLYAVWKNPTLTQYSIPTRSGYVFNGWYTSVDGGTQINVGTAVPSDMTVYAHWEVATYEVSYDSNGGIDAPATQIKTHGKALTLSAEVPNREGYIFRGWATEESGNAVQYQPGAIYSTDNDIVLIAIWEQIELIKIEVKENPNKTNYYLGNTLDTTGLTLKVTCSDGSVKTVTDGFSCSPTVLNTAGTQTITVSYGGKTTTFTVTVNPAVLEKLEIASLPVKTVYTVGESLETAGLTLKATYSDNSVKTITSGFTVSGFDSSAAGEQDLTVAYEGKSVRLTVTVNPKNNDLSYRHGDVNGDGMINLKDLTELRRLLAAGEVILPVEIGNPDVNGDGTVNLKDVTHLRRYLAGGWNVVLP